jgi:hypothetical protein
MSDPGSMSAVTIVAMAVVILVLGIFVSSSINLFNHGETQVKENWVEDSLQPAVASACDDSITEYEESTDHEGSDDYDHISYDSLYYPEPTESDNYLQQSFDMDEMTIEERNQPDSDEVSHTYFIMMRKDGDVQISVPLVNSTKCNSLDMTGSTTGSGRKSFRVQIMEDGEASIEVS